MAGDLEEEKDSRDLILASIHQSSRLQKVLSQSLQAPAATTTTTTPDTSPKVNHTAATSVTETDGGSATPKLELCDSSAEDPEQISETDNDKSSNSDSQTIGASDLSSTLTLTDQSESKPAAGVAGGELMITVSSTALLDISRRLSKQLSQLLVRIGWGGCLRFCHSVGEPLSQ